MLHTMKIYAGSIAKKDKVATNESSIEKKTYSRQNKEKDESNAKLNREIKRNISCILKKGHGLQKKKRTVVVVSKNTKKKEEIKKKELQYTSIDIKDDKKHKKRKKKFNKYFNYHGCCCLSTINITITAGNLLHNW